jgi:hypothetical protein
VTQGSLEIFFKIWKSRIDKFEEEMAKGEVKWMRIDDIHAELKKLHPWL